MIKTITTTSKKDSRSILLLGMLLLFCSILYGQPDSRPSEAEIELQKIFIDANKQKILGNLEDAAFLFKEVIKRDAQNHAAAYELARVYARLDEPDKALAAIEKAIALNNKNIWYHEFHAQVLKQLNKNPEAVQVYDYLAKENPDNQYFLFQKAFFLVKSGKPQEAIKVYNELEKTMGVNEEVSRKKAILYLGLDDSDAAIREMEKLINKFPQDTDYLHFVAEIYNQENKSKKAERIYQKILNINPDDPNAKLALAGKEKEQGNELAFLQTLETIIVNTDVSVDIKVKELLPYIEEAKNSEDPNLQEAILELGNKFANTHPQEAKAQATYADMLYQAGQKNKALDYYKKTLDIDKSIFAVWDQTLYIQYELNQIEDLLEYSELALDYFPNQARVYYMNGIALTITGTPDEAIDAFNQALLISGRNLPLKAEVYNRLGILYFNIQKYKKSDTSFDKALGINPQSPITLNNYAFYLAKRNDRLDEALNMSKQALELDATQAAYMDTYGFVFYQKKDYKNAKKWYQKAISNKDYASFGLYERYGDTLFLLGEEMKAIEQWQKSKELGNPSKELNRKILEKKL